MNSPYLHEKTSRGKGALKIHNLVVDQMSMSDNNGNMMRIPPDEICTKPSKHEEMTVQRMSFMDNYLKAKSLKQITDAHLNRSW